MTPLSEALNAFIFALKDSADAFVASLVAIYMQSDNGICFFLPDLNL